MNTARFITCRPCKTCGVRTSVLGPKIGDSIPLECYTKGPAFSDVFYNPGYGLSIFCKGCHMPKAAQQVKGRISKTHKCNAKCLASTGFLCDCSCGGKNHGAGFEV